MRREARLSRSVLLLLDGSLPEGGAVGPACAFRTIPITPVAPGVRAGDGPNRIVANGALRAGPG